MENRLGGAVQSNTRNRDHPGAGESHWIDLPTAAPAADLDPATSVAVNVLQVAARLHAAARSDPVALRAALKACREWLDCAGVLDLTADSHLLDPDALEGLAGRVTHCAGYGTGVCGNRLGDQLSRARCAALASHLYEAAIAARNALKAMFFDELPPTWILDGSGRVHDSNAPAKVITAAGNSLAVAEGLLAPVVPGGGARLRHTLTDLDHETRFTWPDQHGGETTLLLRPLPAGAGIAATLLREPPTAKQLAPLLAQSLKLTLRQSELAAHLLTGQTLTDAARAMDISRHTANEHLARILQRVGTPNRKALLAILRRAVTY
jgi:DNA-binding CsgD family transcriptional regulator